MRGAVFMGDFLQKDRIIGTFSMAGVPLKLARDRLKRLLGSDF